MNAKEKAALQAAELLVVDLAKEAEAQPGYFTVTLDEELAHAPGNEGFVRLDFHRLVFTCALDSEACFDVYKGEPEKRQ